MAAAIESIEKSLRKWRDCGLEVESAIASRDYARCRRAETEARTVFAGLMELMDDDAGLEALKACKDDVEECVGLWRRNIEAMPDWLDEVKSELDDVGRRISARRKIDGVYSRSEADLKRSGRRVKIKAR